MQPDLRVLVLVCDPARRPATARRPALRAMRRAFERCADGAPAAACAAAAHDDALVGGAYALWLRELLRALPAAQLRVARTEDVRREPQRALREALAFLRLPPARAPLRAAAAEPALLPPAPTPTAAPPWLAGFFEEFNEELVHLLDGDERFRFG